MEKSLKALDDKELLKFHEASDNPEPYSISEIIITIFFMISMFFIKKFGVIRLLVHFKVYEPF